MSAEVFISYAAKDRERVAKLVEGLQQAGVSVWIDMAGIEVAARWSKEIVSAIRECKVLLLSISPHSTESENVVKELALASERKKNDYPHLPRASGDSRDDGIPARRHPARRVF